MPICGPLIQLSRLPVSCRQHSYMECVIAEPIMKWLFGHSNLYPRFWVRLILLSPHTSWSSPPCGLMMYNLYQAFSCFSGWFKGHACSQENRAGDSLGMRLTLTPSTYRPGQKTTYGFIVAWAELQDTGQKSLPHWKQWIWLPMVLKKKNIPDT